VEVVKQRWRGCFNYSRSSEILYAYAFSKEQARVVMCNRIANKHGVHPSKTLSLFKEGKDNHEITIETEFSESE
jgi:hypothetical protein